MELASVGVRIMVEPEGRRSPAKPEGWRVEMQLKVTFFLCRKKDTVETTREGPHVERSLCGVGLPTGKLNSGNTSYGITIR